MYPILFETMTEGTVPTHNGLGVLSDCLSCYVTEERNGAYELTMSYTTGGIHASDIQVNRFIMAKPNFADDPQIFRIYRVGKDIGGQFNVSAQHISYDLSGKIITTGSANDIITACQVLQAKAGAFTISTDKVTAGVFKVNVPSSVRSWFGGKDGSLLDVYGSGEFHYDNYAVSLKQNRGMNRGVVIRYGKNLTELAQELDMSNLCTGVVPYYVDMNGNTYTGAKISTGLTLDVPRDLAVDFSDQVNPDSGTPITTQLASLGAAYIANNNLTNVLNSISLSFVQLEGLSERVDLCDTCHIYFEALGISASVKCISTTWDVLEDRYIETTFGNARTNIADTIANTQKEIEDRPSTSAMEQAVKRATEMITGNLGGYVVLHDSNGDGEPDEILIMDTADINTATKVWRWNSAGLGYSSTGYSGTYGLAMTADGEIVADFIKTGTLNADLIKAGTIEDAAGNSTIDMTNGAATLYKLKSKEDFELIDENDIKRGYWQYRAMGDDTHFALVDALSNILAEIFANSGGGGLKIHNGDGATIMQLIPRLDKSAEFALLDPNQNSRVVLGSPSTGGFAWFNDSSNSVTIDIDGQLGKITCVSLVQTSSRKVKENIKPIEDAKKILELDAVSFDYKNKALGTDKRGFIAEDVQKILPNLVTPETEEKTASLDYIGMIPYLQAVLKQQAEEIKELKKTIKELKGD